MKLNNKAILDANEATASTAYRVSELIAMYPITPSSPMAEFSDEWAAKGKQNVWGTVPEVCQLQSEAGVAGAVHGIIQAGVMSTTFTASQGLLLMIPNMYKIAGELTPFVMHVTARALATHALSIFGDHSDVMSCRQTGFAMLASNSVQEAHDLAAIAHSATLKCRVPFLHFFDGFRTSHEVNTIDLLGDEVLTELMDNQGIHEYRERALGPDKPALRGTAQNPDVFFQAREAVNPFYDATPEAVENAMKQFQDLTGRSYQLFDYVGAPDAERVIICMGSGAETAQQTVEYLNAQGEKLGLLKVRLFRPFSLKHFINALPETVQKIAVLDRTKEPGCVGEPLYQDIVTALADARAQGLSKADPLVTGGRYGLGSKEFSPAMVKAVFDDLASGKPHLRFTVGINDDVTHLSLSVDESFDLESEKVFRNVFFGLGSDGTVGANKNSIKIIGDSTDNFAQAYFVYDSKKSGAMTVSHLRFGSDPIQAPYLIKNAQFVGCHQFQFMEQFDVLSYAAEGATFLLNSVYPSHRVFDVLPKEAQEQIIEKKIRFYVIDAYEVAKKAGMGGRVNTIMQTCFFALAGILPKEEAIAEIKKAIEKSYMKKGPAIVEKNNAAVDAALDNLHEVEVPAAVTADHAMPDAVPPQAPDFVRNVTAMMMRGEGDLLPVSAFAPDGTWPTATTQWEKRSIALEVPIWDSNICIQCNKCALVCPHAAIRSKYVDEAELADAPDGFRSTPFRSREVSGKHFIIQVAPEDCTGCSLCVEVCPAKDKSNPKHKAIDMTPLLDIKEREVANYDFFLKLPEPDPAELKVDVKGSQFRQPLFEYSGACAGCGETPYVKLISQLFGDRMLVANATGCSSIYGGNLPTTPYTVDANGRGPAWSNSLFEDNAEFGYGFRLAADKKALMAADLVKALAGKLGDDFVKELLESPQTSDAEIAAQRERVVALRQKLDQLNGDLQVARLKDLADYLVKKSVWIFGGDGWAYDIGFGGLDHVLASGRNVNILVMDTEVYSNTGGQQSKSTPIGAVAKFAAAGKSAPKKDLGLIAMGYGNVYVASIAMGAKDNHAVKAIAEAESFDGPSLIIAYSHCIAHGFNLSQGMKHQKMAVDTGYWPLYRFDPRRLESGQPPLSLDSAEPKMPLREYMETEARFRMLMQADPERARLLSNTAQTFVSERYNLYKQRAAIVGLPAAEAETAQ